jgi:transcriptional regulator with XRE-family HTH domain
MTSKPRQTNFPIMEAEELRAARQEMGLTQQEAANKYELSLRGYKQYELGERPIPGPVRLLTKYFLQEYRKVTAK